MSVVFLLVFLAFLVFLLFPEELLVLLLDPIFRKKVWFLKKVVGDSV